MPDIFSFLILILALAGLGWFGWISYQSLRQARLLAAAAHGSIRDHVGGIAAVYGAVRVTRPISDGHLWRRRVKEERSGFGKKRRWHVLSDQTEVARFTLEADGLDVDVAGPPTEVQGSRSATQYSGGWLSRDARVRTYWLPVLPSITALGRLEPGGRGMRLVQDSDVGLLFSPHAPRKAAAIELVKGIVGLVLLAAGVTAVLLLLVPILRQA